MRSARHVAGDVLAALELVADDGHFDIEVCLADKAVDQPVGFEAESQIEVLVGGGQGFVIVGAVDPGRAVEAGAVVVQRLWDVGVVGVPLKTMCSSRWAMPVSP